ncbi:MAG: hypothetical protein FD149_2578, partial [Rhodospirillaceae bacterium]
AAFVGKGKTFQIWKPEVFKKMHDEMRDRVLKNRPTLVLPKRSGS